MMNFIGRLDNISIKNKILASYLLIIIVSLASLAFFANSVSTGAIIEKAKYNSIRELSLVSRSLTAIVTKTEDYARILITDESFQKILSGYIKEKMVNSSETDASPYNIDIENLISGSVSNIIQSSSSLATYSIMTMEGKLFNAGDFDESSLHKIFGKEYLSNVVTEKIPVWTGIISVKSKSGDYRNVFAVSKLIIDVPTGNFLGIAVIYLKETEINSTYLSNNNMTNQAFYIIDKKGKVMSASNKKELSKDFKQIIRNSYKTKFDYFGDGCKFFKSMNSQLLFTVKTFEKLDWRVVSIVPIDEITKENRYINRLILNIGVICLIFSFATAFWVSRSITNPIFKLVDLMKGIGRGNLALRAEIKSGNEIGLIGNGFNDLMGRIQILIDDVRKEQKSKREYEFKLIQSQIKPHFLYNSLETIVSLVKLGMNEDAINTTRNLADFYRYSLSKGNDIIKIADEIQLIKSYLSIQRVRYSKYMDFSINVDRNILDYSIPKLTLQPLVENSIYHGLKPKAANGKIVINGYLTDEMIFFEVFDNGMGIPEDRINQLLELKQEKCNKVDFGLGSTNKRIKLVYGDEYGISIMSEEGAFTRIILCIPAIKI